MQFNSVHQKTLDSKALFANGNNTNDTDGVILIVMLIVLGV